MSLEQVTREIIDAHNIRPNIRDDKPDAYHIFFQVGHLTIGYKRFLPREGIPQDVSTLIEKGNESQLREYFEHGPYGEILTVAAIPHIEVTATAYVLQGEIPFAQDITIRVTSSEAEKYMNRLQESGNPISQAFCTADKRIRIEDAQDKKHTFRVKYPFTDDNLVDFMNALLSNKNRKQKDPCLYPLQKVFESIGSSEFVRYRTNALYPTTVDGQLVELQAHEVLEIGRDCGVCPREHIMFAYFDNEPTKLLYVGEDVRSMRETINKLRLPRWSDNVGDRVFSRIRNDLHFRAETGPECIEYTVNPGNEYHFRVVLKKLVDVYQRGCALHSSGSFERAAIR